MSGRAQCITQPRTHHLCSQHGRSRPVCRRPDRAAADEAAHHRSRPRWLSGHFHWLQVRIRARQPSLPPYPACLTRRNEPCDRQAQPYDHLLAQETISRSSLPSSQRRYARAQSLTGGSVLALMEARCASRALHVPFKCVCRAANAGAARRGPSLGRARALVTAWNNYLTGAVRDHSRADLGLLG